MACSGGEDVVAPETGALVLQTTTDHPPAALQGYTVSIDGGAAQSITPNETITVSDLPVGNHTVLLSGIPEGCSLAGDNPRAANIPAGGRTELTFEVSCPQPGSILIRTTTANTPAGFEGYTVSVDGGTAQAIGPEGSLTVEDQTAGDHSVALAGAPEGCTLAGDNPRTATVPAGGSTEVDFAVACPPPPGIVSVTTTTTGPGPDPDGYSIVVDRGMEVPIGVNATVQLSPLPPGQHSIQLTGVASNCTVSGDNPRAIDVAAGAPLAVSFAVACVVGALQFTTMTSGTTADLAEVWGSGPADVFAVGEVATGDGSASVVQHFDGQAWQPQYRQDDLILRGLWGSSSTDVYAVGFTGPGATVLHFNGAAWTQADNFTNEEEDLAFLSIWGSSATDIFAVGGSFAGQIEQSLIVHYDGSDWRRMQPPADRSPVLSEVWGSGPRDVYAVGRDDRRATAVIIRFDGSTWSSVHEEEDARLNAIWGSSATDVFAVGFEVQNDDVISTIRHFDGTTWSRMDVPRVGVLQDVWGSSPTDVYAAGDDGAVLHYDGTAWTESPRATRQALLGVWGSSAADVFLVGDRGTIVHGAP